ncbi:MAG TPA: hypothetical protein VMB70_10980, partial [Terriglobia bacterium]|nr:hypothetical protein [Terriglobia bacterium]
MMRPRFALFFFLILVTASFAQQVGRLPRIPLPDASPVVDTVEGKIRVVPVGRGLSHPWSLAFLP